MILILTNSEDSHADVVAERLRHSGESVTRLDLDRLAAGRSLLTIAQPGSGTSRGEAIASLNGKVTRLNDLRSVWFRRPELQTHSSDAEAGLTKLIRNEWSSVVGNLCAVVEPRRWMNEPQRIREARRKIRQLEAARSVGLRVPDSLVTNSAERLLAFWEHHRGAIVIKGMSGTFLERVAEDGGLPKAYGLFTTQVTAKSLATLKPSSTFECPVLVQERIDKRYELRVTVVGGRFFSARIDSQDHSDAVVDYKRAPVEELPHYAAQLPETVEEQCLKLMAGFGLNFAAIDLAVTSDGEHVFFEINPNGQWLWVEELTGLPIAQSIADWLSLEP